MSSKEKNFDLDLYFKIADKAVDNISRYLMSEFGPMKRMKLKEHDHFSIKEDDVANEMYEKFLRKKTPEIQLFTEEGEQVLGDDLVWVIDPIEGTSNYRVGIPFFATTICLISGEVPMLSIVSAPALRQKFHALKEKGAYLNKRIINPSKVKYLSQAMISIGRGRKKEDKIWYTDTQDKLLPRVRTSRTLGSAGLDMAYTAAGMFDIYLARSREGGAPYDVLPGLMLLQEAGCKVVNGRGKKFSLGDRLLLASNEELVLEVLKII